MNRRSLILFLSLITAFVASAQPRSTPAEAVAQYDAYGQRAILDWKVPGLTVTVVKDGKVLFKKGYGVREQNKPELVDTQTLFALASTTKAMTAACIGMLVDEGKLRWDDPVLTDRPSGGRAGSEG